MYRIGETATGPRAPIASTSKTAAQVCAWRYISVWACLGMLASTEAYKRRYAQYDDTNISKQVSISARLEFKRGGTHGPDGKSLLPAGHLGPEAVVADKRAHQERIGKAVKTPRAPPLRMS